jgi:hypothetical protein
MTTDTLTLFEKPAARVSPAAPTPRAAAAGCARPAPEATRRPTSMAYLDVPLSGLSDSTLAALDKLGPGWTWGRDEAGNFFVEDGARRCIGRSLVGAIGVALQAQRIVAGLDLEDDAS